MRHSLLELIPDLHPMHVSAFQPAKPDEGSEKKETMMAHSGYFPPERREYMNNSGGLFRKEGFMSHSLGFDPMGMGGMYYPNEHLMNRSGLFGGGMDLSRPFSVGMNMMDSQPIRNTELMLRSGSISRSELQQQHLSMVQSYSYGQSISRKSSQGNPI